jgi:hypothetical protein
MILAMKKRQKLDDVWFQVKMGGNIIHEWEQVATGANKSRSDVVNSTCHALTCSTFSTLASSFSNTGCSTFLGMLSRWSPISPLNSLSKGALRVLLRVLSISGSKGINSKFWDLRPSIHQAKDFFFVLNKKNKNKNKTNKIN